MIGSVGHLPSAAQIRQAGAKYLGKAGSAFYAALSGLYAAHMEKAQMRLAPTREARFHRVGAGYPWPRPGDF
jgi:hypothetical protein